MTEIRRYCNNSIRFSLSRSFELIHSELKGATHVLTSEAAAMLETCRKFETLDEHARKICELQASSRGQMDSMLMEASAQILPSFVTKLLRRGGAVSQGNDASKLDRAEFESIKNQLSGFVEMGLMASDADLKSLIEKHYDTPEPAREVTSVGVVTHNRVESLAHCLASYAENVKEHGRRTDFVVADDSDDPRVRESNRETLASLKKKYGVGAFYAGPEEKKGFTDELARRFDIPPDVLTFALFGEKNCGVPIGANRNALFLHTVGEMVFSADDDTVCRLAAKAQPQNGIALSSESDPTRFWFFPSREAALQSVTFVDEDVLAIHEQMLGRKLGSCISALEGENGPQLSQATSRFLRGLRDGMGRVFVTFNGVVGDSGMYSPHSYFLLDEDSHRRLTLSEDKYRFATTSREILRVAERHTISSEAWFPATTMGFDNRSLLPPFFPVLRNEDGVFGATVRACFENAYSGFLPRALLHAPLEPRSYTREGFHKSASSHRLCDIVIACLSAFAPPGVTDENRRMRALGDFLTGVAALTPRDFEEFIRVRLYWMVSAYAYRLEEDLQSRAATPDYWAEDIKAYLNSLTRALSNKEYVVPNDLARLRGNEEALGLAQVLVRNFGRLLCLWPEIVAAAKDLRAQGRRLAVEI